MKDLCQYGNRQDNEWEILPWIPDPRPPFKIWVKPEQIAPFFLIPHHPYAISLLLKISDGFRTEKFLSLIHILDKQAVEECRRVLSAFFAEMTEWEQYMEQAGFEDAQAVPRLLAIWEKYVSEKPRPGYRPLGLSYSAQGTYKGEEFLDAEQITKNKLYIYTREKNTGFDRRFLMKRVGDNWMIDGVQERLDGWQRTGL